MSSYITSLRDVFKNGDVSFYKECTKGKQVENKQIIFLLYCASFQVKAFNPEKFNVI